MRKPAGRLAGFLARRALFQCVVMFLTSEMSIAGTTFARAGTTRKFIVPAGGAGLITACFAQNLVCIRPVGS